MIERYITIEDYEIIADIVMRSEKFKEYKIEEISFRELKEDRTTQSVLFKIYSRKYHEIGELFFHKYIGRRLTAKINLNGKTIIDYISEEEIEKWLS